MRLFQVNVIMLSGTQVGFVFKTEQRGLEVRGMISAAWHEPEHSGEIQFIDDYGQSFNGKADEIAAVRCGDLAKQLDGQVEAGMIQTRAQAEGMARAQADPKLKLIGSSMPAGLVRS